MTPDQARSMYRRFLQTTGERISFRRYTGTGLSRTSPIYDPVLARVAGYATNELIGGILEGDRNVIVLADDVAACGLTLPPLVTDKIVVRGKELAIVALDDSKRRIAGVLIAYEIRVRG